MLDQRRRRWSNTDPMAGIGWHTTSDNLNLMFINYIFFILLASRGNIAEFRHACNRVKNEEFPFPMEWNAENGFITSCYELAPTICSGYLRKEHFGFKTSKNFNHGCRYWHTTHIGVNEGTLQIPGRVVGGPANTKHLCNISTMSDQRRRRWADVVQMLHKCFVFAGWWLVKQTSWHCRGTRVHAPPFLKRNPIRTGVMFYVLLNFHRDRLQVEAGGTTSCDAGPPLRRCPAVVWSGIPGGVTVNS